MRRLGPTRSVGVAVAVFLLLAVAAYAKRVTLDTSPVSGGRVSVNGTYVGVAPVTYTVKLKKNQSAVATARREGAISLWPTRFSKTHRGVVMVRLEPDRAWEETLVSEIANTWLTVAPSRTRGPDGLDEDRVWQKIVSIVSDNFSDLEQVDRESFYLRTAWRVRSFPYTTLRHRLVVKRGVSGDLSVKVRLESKIYRGQSRSPSLDEFEDHDRVFQSDKDTIDYLSDQL